MLALAAGITGFSGICLTHHLIEATVIKANSQAAMISLMVKGCIDQQFN